MFKFHWQVSLWLLSFLCLIHLSLGSNKLTTDQNQDARREASEISGQILKQQHQLLAALRSRQFAQRLPSPINLNDTKPQIKRLNQDHSPSTSNRTKLPVAKTQIKRQTEAQNEQPKQHHISKRNEDPWFLDQEPYTLQPYRFVYNIRGKNGQAEQFRQEVGDGKYVTGSYGYFLPDGIYRHVDYVADDRGFRAYIRTSEPGIANQNPADVVINSNPIVPPVTPSVTYAAPGSPRNIDPSISPSPYLGSTLVTPADQLAQIRRPPGSIVSGDRGDLLGLTNLTSSRYLDSARLNQPLSASINLTSNSSPQWPPSGSIVNNAIRRFDSVAFTTPAPTSGFGFTSRSQQSSLPGPGSYRSYDGDSSKYRASDAPNLSPNNNQQASLFGQLGNISRPASSSPFAYGPGNEKEPDMTTVSRSPSSSLSSFFGSQSPSRTATNLLLYDQIPMIGGGNPNIKLSYDFDHLRHPDSALLAYERARHLAQIDQLNARAGLPLASLTPSLPSTSQLNPLPGLSFSQISKPTEQRYSQQTSGSSYGSSSHSSEHVDQHNRKFEIAEPNQGSVTRESSTGTKSGSGKTVEFGRHSGLDHHERPPQPQFPRSQFDINTKSAAAIDATKAPYSVVQQQEDDRRFSIEGQNPPVEQPNISASPALSQVQAPITLAEEQSRNTPVLPSKGGPKLALDRPARWSSPFDERQGDTLRNAMMMADWRKMQGTLGLPQPPRSPKPTSGDLLARALKLDISATKPSKSLVSAIGDKTARSSLSTGPLSFKSLVDSQVSKVFEDDRANSIDGSDLLASSNGTNFDARRLTSADRKRQQATKLQAEKVSELEKFQQRLRAQQLLLDQSQKQQQQQSEQENRVSSRTNNSLNNYKQLASVQLTQRQPNSQVSYDEDVDNASLQTRSTTSSPSKQTIIETKAREATARDNFVAKLKSWPSLVVNQTLEPIKSGPSAHGKQQSAPATTAATTNSSSSQLKPAEKPNKPANTINLDFINSVTALSVDQMNPFALTSVNPALQQLQQQRSSSAGQQPQASDHLISVRSSSRLTPHKLEPSLGSSMSSISTSSARYFSSPELLAAMNHHERVDTGGQLRSLLPSMSSVDPGDSQRSGISENPAPRGTSPLWASNHRYPTAESSVSAPYMLMQASGETRSLAPNHRHAPVKRHVSQSKSLEVHIKEKKGQLASNQRFYEVASSSSSIVSTHLPNMATGISDENRFGPHFKVKQQYRV